MRLGRVEEMRIPEPSETAWSYQYRSREWLIDIELNGRFIGMGRYSASRFKRLDNASGRNPALSIEHDLGVLVVLFSDFSSGVLDKPSIAPHSRLLVLVQSGR